MNSVLISTINHYNGDNPDIAHMFKKYGYLLNIKKKGASVKFHFYMREDCDLGDGIRIFKKYTLVKYKTPIVVFFTDFFETKGKNYDYDFIVHLGEYPSGSKNVLSFCKKYGDGDLLMYSPDVMKFLYHMDQYEDQNYNSDWDSKISKAIFRGSLSGDVSSKNPRYLAMYHSYMNPDFLDAALTSGPYYYLMKSCNGEYLPIEYKTGEPSSGNYLSLVDQSNYKYYLLIDGFVAPWRTIACLFMKSLILKVDSDYIENYYNDLLPGVHYIQIKSDLSDLTEKIMWCKNNDDICKNIVENAYAYACRKFTKENIFEDTFRLLKFLADFNIQSTFVKYNTIDKSL